MEVRCMDRKQSIHEEKTLRKFAMIAMAMIILTLAVLVPLTALAADNPLKITVNQAFTTSGGVFMYILKPLTPGIPMPAGSTDERYTFTIIGTGSTEVEFSFFGEPGVYKYDLRQVIIEEIVGYTYDKSVYTIEAHVDEELNVIVVVYVTGREGYEDNAKADDITFSNQYAYDPPEFLMVDPPIVKTVFGYPSRASTFAFRLEAKDPSYPMPADSVGGTKTIYITGSGKGEFGTWNYYQAGTYYYTVYEVNTMIDGYTYDEARYTITDMVSEDHGKLVLYRVVHNSTNRQVTSLIFNNYYDDGPTGGGEPTPPTDPPSTEPPPPSEPSEPTGPDYVPGTQEIETKPDFDINDGGTPGGGTPVGGRDSEELPKTGDESQRTLYATMFAMSSIIAIGAAIYLINGDKGRVANEK
jgi:pilin isopeptide linkage protein